MSEKKSLLKIDNDSENPLINKSLDLAFTHFDKKKSKSIMSYTSLVDKQFINDSLPDQFGLSLIQSQIVKEYEIRVFFIGDKFFSTAILSQNDNKTALDYRRYNKDNMNRNLSYKINDNLKIKLLNLMNELCLKTGSIDLIKDTEGNYIFLEVNPAGQYGYISHNCNYHYDKLIAEYIIQNKKQ